MTDVGAGGCDSRSGAGAPPWHPAAHAVSLFWGWAMAVLQLTGTRAWGCRQRRLAPTHLTQPLHSTGRRRTGVSGGWFAEIPSGKYFLPLPQTPAEPSTVSGSSPCTNRGHGAAV